MVVSGLGTVAARDGGVRVRVRVRVRVIGRYRTVKGSCLVKVHPIYGNIIYEYNIIDT